MARSMRGWLAAAIVSAVALSGCAAVHDAGRYVQAKAESAKARAQLDAKKVELAAANAKSRVEALALVKKIRADLAKKKAPVPEKKAPAAAPAAPATQPPAPVSPAPAPVEPPAANAAPVPSPALPIAVPNRPSLMDLMNKLKAPQ